MARLFYGWVIVGGAFIVLFTAYGTQYAFGVFFPTLLEEFGWSRASLSGVFSLYAFLYCLFGLPAGRLTDRWGPRAVIAMGGLLLGLGLTGMSQVRALWHPYLFYGIVAALGMSTAYVPCNSTVVKWFVSRRGLAVGLASSGGAAGTFLVPPLAHLIVNAVGWRWAYVVLGTGALVTLNLTAMVMRRDPETMSLAPEGAPGDPAAVRPSGDAAWPLGRAVGTSGFWLLSGVFICTWIPVFIPFVHVVAFARDLGIAPLLAASAISAIGIAATGGRLLMGAVSDRIGRKSALAIALVLQALSFAGFVGVNGLSSLYLVAVGFGFSYGAVSALFPSIVGDFFGREQAGSLVGFVFALAGSTGALGAVGAGAIYDATGQYTWAFLTSAGLNSLALILLALARPPR